MNEFETDQLLESLRAINNRLTDILYALERLG